MRLALIISTLQAGGAERVLTTLANGWVDRGDEITLITLGRSDSDFYVLDPRVRRLELNLLGTSRGLFDKLRLSARRVTALRQALKQTEADAVVSFIDRTNLLTLLATVGLPVPVIVSERIDPRQEAAAWTTRLLRRVLYPRAASLVVQTESVAEWARQVVSRDRVVVIPNPVRLPQTMPELPRQLKIVAVGRLQRQKGFDLLVEAFAMIAARHPSWNLDIFGEGPERERLQSLIAQQGLSDRVMLRGVVSEIDRPLREAGLFVMPSRYEGFPNALVEAMACGCPVISTDCPSGPGEIIRHQHDGWLVPSENVSELAEAMSCLIDSESDRRRLGANATSVCERFGIDRVLNLWDNLIHRNECC